MRSAEITRETRETKIRQSLCLQGGTREIQSGIVYHEHLLHSKALHGSFSQTL